MKTTHVVSLAKAKCKIAEKKSFSLKVGTDSLKASTGVKAGQTIRRLAH